MTGALTASASRRPGSARSTSNPSALEERSCPSWSGSPRVPGDRLVYIRRGNQRLCLFRADSPSPLRMNVRPATCGRWTNPPSPDPADLQRPARFGESRDHGSALHVGHHRSARGLGGDAGVRHRAAPDRVPLALSGPSSRLTSESGRDPEAAPPRGRRAALVRTRRTGLVIVRRAAAGRRRAAPAAPGESHRRERPAPAAHRSVYGPVRRRNRRFTTPMVPYRCDTHRPEASQACHRAEHRRVHLEMFTWDR